MRLSQCSPKFSVPKTKLKKLCLNDKLGNQHYLMDHYS